jgi:hypothetical protein
MRRLCRVFSIVGAKIILAETKEKMSMAGMWFLGKNVFINPAELKPVTDGSGRHCGSGRGRQIF